MSGKTEIFKKTKQVRRVTGMGCVIMPKYYPNYFDPVQLINLGKDPFERVNLADNPNMHPLSSRCGRSY